MMIVHFYTKPLQDKLFRLFWDLILNLREEDISNMENSEELMKTENKIENTDRGKLPQPTQEWVVENEKVGSLNTGNRDVGIDDV